MEVVGSSSFTMGSPADFISSTAQERTDGPCQQVSNSLCWQALAEQILKMFFFSLFNTLSSECEAGHMVQQFPSSDIKPVA